MICVDNSEWMRNGDYQPTRMVSQNETVNFIAQQKINGNPETTVGVLTTAGRRVEVLVTPTRRINLIMTALSQVELGEQCSFISALKTAQLALKNRPNKHQKQRIIAFAGSPITDEKKALIKQGKMFRMNNIAVDVVNFGSENASNGNVEKLEAFINAVNKKDSKTSHLVNVPSGSQNLSNIVLTSPILVQGASSASVPSSSGVRVGGPAVDEGEDRDFQLAVRLSLEASRQAQEQAAKQASTSTPATTEAKTTTTSKPVETKESAALVENAADDDEEEEDEDFDEEEFARAIAMSLAASNEGKEQAKETPAADAEGDQDEDMEALEDPDFIRSLLDDADADDVDDILNQLNDDE